MSESGDCASVASSIAQETLQYIQNESERQRRRLQSLKKNSSTMGIASSESLGLRSIMIVKSLEESLSRQGSRGSHITSLKRKVRVMKRNVDLSGLVEGVTRRHSTMGSLDSSPDSSPLRKVTIGFSSITIREHPVIPGENPGVSCGVPLTLDWEHDFEDKFDLDEFESNKTQKRRQVEMKIPASKRADMLRKNGFGWVDIQKSIKQANISRHKRKKTLEQLERQEKFRNGFKKFFVGGKKSAKKKSSKSEDAVEISVDDAEQEYQDISKLKRMDSLRFIDTKKNYLNDDDELDSSCRSESLQRYGGLDHDAKSYDEKTDKIEISVSRSPKKYNLDLELDEDDIDDNDDSIPVQNIEITKYDSEDTNNEIGSRDAIAKDTISTHEESEFSICTTPQDDEFLMENEANKIAKKNDCVEKEMHVPRERTFSSTSIVSETEINCVCFPYVIKLERKNVV